MESYNKENNGQSRCNLQRVESTYRNEDVPQEKEPEKMRFELKNEEGSDSLEEEESFESNYEVETQTPTLRMSNYVRRST